MTGPNWKLEDDLATVTITFPTEPPVSIKWDVAAVSETLKALGDFRAHMKPAIPDDWRGGQKVGAIPDPRWYVEPEMMEGNSLLHIRDPRFGWMHYLIPREEARKLGEYLIAQADSPPPGPKQERPM